MRNTYLSTLLMSILGLISFATNPSQLPQKEQERKKRLEEKQKEIEALQKEITRRKQERERKKRIAEKQKELEALQQEITQRKEKRRLKELEEKKQEEKIREEEPIKLEEPKKEKEKEKEFAQFAIFDRPPLNREDLAQITEKIFRPLSDKFESYIGQIKFINRNQWSVSPYYDINKELIKKFWNLKTDKHTINLKVQEYKIHLMPEIKDIPKYIKEVLNTISKDSKLQQGIFLVKAMVAYPEELYAKEGAPKIIIYVYGKENAQYALDTIYQTFKNEKASGQKPDYNEHVTNFIFFTQGDRNDKQMYQGDIFKSVNPYEDSMVYFDPDKIEKNLGWQLTGSKDYHLINPAAEEKRRGSFVIPQPMKQERQPEQKKKIILDITTYLDNTDKSLTTIQDDLAKTPALISDNQISEWLNSIDIKRQEVYSLSRRFAFNSLEEYVKNYERMFKDNFQSIPGITKENVLEKVAGIAYMKGWNYYYKRLKENTISLDDYEQINKLIDDGIILNTDNENAKKYFRQLGYFFQNRYAAEEFIAYLSGNLANLFIGNTEKRKQLNNKIIGIINKITDVKMALLDFQENLKKQEEEIKEWTLIKEKKK